MIYKVYGNRASISESDLMYTQEDLNDFVEFALDMETSINQIKAINESTGIIVNENKITEFGKNVIEKIQAAIQKIIDFIREKIFKRKITEVEKLARQAKPDEISGKAKIGTISKNDLESILTNPNHILAPDPARLTTNLKLSTEMDEVDITKDNVFKHIKTIISQSEKNIKYLNLVKKDRERTIKMGQKIAELFKDDKSKDEMGNIGTTMISMIKAVSTYVTGLQVASLNSIKNCININPAGSTAVAIREPEVVG